MACLWACVGAGLSPAAASTGVPLDNARVFPADTRVPVVDASVWPFSAIGEVQAWWGSKAFASTGVLVSRDVVLTAAHSVYRADLGGWADRVLFTPARKGAEGPFGVAQAIRMTVPYAYVDRKRQADDIAQLTLDQPLGDLAGWLRVDGANLPLEGLIVMSAGYPMDKTRHQMHSVIGNTTVLFNDLLYTDIDAAFGQSGSPIWVTDGDGQPVVVAVLVAELDGGGLNIAVPVNESVVARLSEKVNTASTPAEDLSGPSESAKDVPEVSPAFPCPCGFGAWPAMIGTLIGLTGFRGAGRFRRGR